FRSGESLEHLQAGLVGGRCHDVLDGDVRVLLRVPGQELVRVAEVVERGHRERDRAVCAVVARGALPQERAASGEGQDEDRQRGGGRAPPRYWAASTRSDVAGHWDSSVVRTHACQVVRAI